MIENRTNSPKVSVLIPVYNREALIGECIQSALDQTFTDFEIIIVDNASTDKTWEVCQQYAAVDNRLRIFRNDTNIGPVRNWLACVEKARGEYGKILFSDDLIFPRFLERTLPYLEDKNVAFVSTAVLIGETPDQGFVHYRPSEKVYRLPSSRYWGLLFNLAAPYSPGAGIFRMADICENLLTSIPTRIDRDFTKNGAGPDVLLYALTSIKYKEIVMLPDCDVFFRVHPGSISMRNCDNEVVKGYYAAMAWFCRYKLDRSHWARYVARTWLLKVSVSHQLISMRRHCVEYEGDGSFIEIVIVSWNILQESVAFLLRRLQMVF